MSAITKPFIKASATAIVAPKVNIEEVRSYEPFTINSFPNNPDRFEVHFTLQREGSSTLETVIWAFADASDRDAQIVLIDTAVATTLV